MNRHREQRMTNDKAVRYKTINTHSTIPRRLTRQLINLFLVAGITRHCAGRSGRCVIALRRRCASDGRRFTCNFYSNVRGRHIIAAAVPKRNELHYCTDNRHRCCETPQRCLAKHCKASTAVRPLSLPDGQRTRTQCSEVMEGGGLVQL